MSSSKFTLVEAIILTKAFIGSIPPNLKNLFSSNKNNILDCISRLKDSIFARWSIPPSAFSNSPYWLNAAPSNEPFS